MTLILIITVIVCILLILIVLIQNPKGGGIASNFSAGNQIMGVKKTNDFVEKATWSLAIGLIVIAMIAGLVGGGSTAGDGSERSLIQDQILNGDFTNQVVKPNEGLPPAAQATDENKSTIAPGETKKEEESK
ncbi:MAG: preprotein translocase subunit SecG [Bacteroidia bacterium]|jgi:preprotein translocase subunit SecG